jgi:hypothetical protein
MAGRFAIGVQSCGFVNVGLSGKGLEEPSETPVKIMFLSYLAIARRGVRKVLLVNSSRVKKLSSPSGMEPTSARGNSCQHLYCFCPTLNSGDT